MTRSINRTAGYEDRLMITLSPLWETMKKKNISQYALLNQYGISRGMLHNLKKDKNITLETLNKLCNILDCDITDIIKYTKEEPIQIIENSDAEQKG